MPSGTQNSLHLKPQIAGYVYWLAIAAAVVVGLAVVLYFSGWRYANVPAATPSFRAGCIGRFLLAAAAVAYAIRWRDLRRSCEAAGSGMAAVAIVALILSVVLRGFETENNLLTVNVYGDLFYRLLVGFLALSITAYLIMEWWYQDRSAGVWVISTAAVAVTSLEFELVRMMPGDSVAVLRAYWHSTTVLLSVVGYLLLAAGCALALISLIRNTNRIPFPISHSALLSYPAEALEAWMVRFNLGGFVLLIASAMLWEGWAAGVPRTEWFVSPIEPWVFATALLYGGHFFLLRMLRPALAQTAFWVASIYLISLVSFVGINAGMA